MPDLGLYVVDDLAVQFQPLSGIGAMTMPVAGLKSALSQASEAVETLAEGVVGVVDDRRAHIGQAAIGEAVGGRAWCGHKGILALLGGTWKGDLWILVKSEIICMFAHYTVDCAIIDQKLIG